MNDLEKLKAINPNLYLVTSPPRTGSTLLGNCLALSDDIKFYLHEPSFELKYNKPDTELIYEQILSSLTKFKTKSLLIKEMSHWLSINDSYQQLFEIVQKPIIFLIRDPLISTESKLRRSLMTCNLRDKSDLQQILKNHILKNESLTTWEELINNKSRLKELKIIEPTPANTKPTQEKCSNFHLSLLNYYARSKGYANWDKMIKKLFWQRDYTDFSEILENEKIFSKFDLGWESLAEQIQYCIDTKIDFYLVDGTDFRIEPEKVVNNIADELDVQFSKRMTKWGASLNYQGNSQIAAFQQIWYQTLNKSSGVMKPTEIPPYLRNFPKGIATYLIEKCLPIYFGLYFAKFNNTKNLSVNLEEKIVIPANFIGIELLVSLKILPEASINKEETKVGKEIQNQLINLSIFKPRQEFNEELFDADDANSDGILVSLKHINPIYSVIKKPELLKDTKFLSTHSKGYYSIFKLLEQYVRN